MQRRHSTLVLPILSLLLFFASGCAEASPGFGEARDGAILPEPTQEDYEKTPDQPAASPNVAIVDSGSLSPALIMNAGRAAHSATLLPDGRVLIAGGFRQEGPSEVSIASAELFDPVTQKFTPVGEMNEARSGHTATLLPSGQVLIVGGWGPDDRLSTSELYDPEAGVFTPGASMMAPRASMTATILQDGKLLIAGGDSGRNTPQLIAELYDAAAGRFIPTGSLGDGRSAHTATLLADGRVLLAGGGPRYDRATILASAEIYDPESGEFISTGSMNAVRYKHAAVLLRDGGVLLLGGSNQDDWRGMYASAELYDPVSAEFTPIPSMSSERFKLAQAAVLLDSGSVFIGGGSRHMELFDPQNQRFQSAGTIDDAYYFSAATLLEDGRVLITGGYNSSITPSDKAWVYSYT